MQHGLRKARRGSSPSLASLITAKRCCLVSSSSSSFSGQSDPPLPPLFFSYHYPVLFAWFVRYASWCPFLPPPGRTFAHVPLLPLVQKDPKDFDWYNNLNTVNQRGKVVDNIDDITACLIDC